MNGNGIGNRTTAVRSGQAASGPDTPRQFDDQHLNELSNSDLIEAVNPSNEAHDRHIVKDRDVSRHGTVNRGDLRPVETDRVMSRSDVTDAEFGADRNSGGHQSDRAHASETEESPRPFADWVDIETADEILKENGISRTIRTIQRLCKKGQLTAKLVPTENGVRYLIERGSIHEFVDQHHQTMPSGKADNDDQPVGQAGTAQPINQEQSPQTVNADILALKNEQIAFLKDQLSISNEQIRVKDEQITTMLERDHETNVLIQNLQNILGAQAQSDRLPDRPSIKLNE